MKVLSIEEKAKRYDDVVSKLGRFMAQGVNPLITRADVQDFFPELAESEDEKIRKEIINYLKRRVEMSSSIPAAIGYWIAWLEAQGEHANFRNKIQIGDKVTRNKDGVLVNLSQLKRVAKKDKKQGEQKTAEWSEEDEKMLDYALDMIEWYSVVDKSKSKRVSDWLKSHKDRIQPQNNIVTDEELAQAKKEAYNDALNKIEYHSGEPTFDDGWSAAIWYLKKRNAMPQSIWKPSDEQMEALRYVTNFDYGGHKATLVSLYEQLKKLRGE